MLTLHDRAGDAGKTADINDGRSQTQPETQLIPNIETRPKRKSREEQNERTKRAKISLGDGADLGA